MKNRLLHIFIQFLIISLMGLGSTQAGTCFVVCVLCEAPATQTVMPSCCDDMLSAGQDEKVSFKAPLPSSPAECGHGDLCSPTIYPVEAGINNSNIFDDVGLLAPAPVLSEPLFVFHLNPDVVPHPPPDDSCTPLYTRNCSYLI